MNRRLRQAVLAIAVAISGAILLGAPAHAAESSFAPGNATASFTQQSVWDTGYVGSFTITNGTESRLTWQVEFDLPAGSTVEHVWGAQTSRVGNRYDATGEPWNATIQPGTSAVFGFIASGTGAPLTWRVNDGPCAGPGCAALDIEPPRTPGDLREVRNSGTSTLTWSASSDDVGPVRYEVYLGTGNNGTALATVTETKFAYTPPPSILMVLRPKNYGWRVRAIDAAGNASPFAVLNWFGLPDTTAPTAPTDLAFNGASGSFTWYKFSWGPATDDFVVAGYDLYVNGTYAGSTSQTTLRVPTHGVRALNVSVVAFDGSGNRSPAATGTWLLP